MGKRTILVLFIVAFSASLSGQAPAIAELSKRLEKKTLYVRGFPNDAVVTYDAGGNPVQPFTKGSWTLGQLYIEQVKFGGAEIEISGKRVGQEYEGSRRKERRTDEKQTLSIKVDPSTLTAAAIEALVNSLFIVNETEIRKEPLSQWVRSKSSGLPPIPENIEKIGGAVKPPNALATQHSKTDKAAAKLRFQGTIVLLVVVDQEGKVVEIRVRKPVGMGLDEKAIEQVQQWRFEPAKRNGHPVAVAFNVQVNFNLD